MTTTPTPDTPPPPDDRTWYDWLDPDGPTVRQVARILDTPCATCDAAAGSPCTDDRPTPVEAQGMHAWFHHARISAAVSDASGLGFLNYDAEPAPLDPGLMVGPVGDVQLEPTELVWYDTISGDIEVARTILRATGVHCPVCHSAPGENCQGDRPATIPDHCVGYHLARVGGGDPEARASLLTGRWTCGPEVMRDPVLGTGPFFDLDDRRLFDRVHAAAWRREHEGSWDPDEPDRCQHFDPDRGQCWLPVDHQEPHRYVGHPVPDSLTSLVDARSYRAAVEWLADGGCLHVEDWAPGDGAFAEVASAYGDDAPFHVVGIDGSVGPHVHRQADLTEYRSTAEGVFMRGVAERTHRWIDVLLSVSMSFQRRAVVVFTTPMLVTDDDDPVRLNAVDQSLPRRTVERLFRSAGARYAESTIATDNGYGTETIYRLWKPGHGPACASCGDPDHDGTTCVEPHADPRPDGEPDQSSVRQCGCDAYQPTVPATPGIPATVTWPAF